MTQKSYVWNGNDPVNETDPSGYISTVGNAWPGGVDLNSDEHAFVEVREDNMGEVFEYGPQNINPWSNVVPQPGYGSWLGNSISGESFVLPPVNGLSGDALDAAVISVYSGLSTFLQNHSACYCSFNSNTVIAAGLLSLGYTPAQINKWIPGPTGVPGSQGTPAKTGQALLDYIKAALTAEEQNAQTNLGLMGSNGMDYCYSCGWSGLLNK